MQCTATDMSARGCYIESLVPLMIGCSVFVTFWLDSDKIRTSGIVRASDPGVGMGIEFTARRGIGRATGILFADGGTFDRNSGGIFCTREARPGEC